MTRLWHAWSRVLCRLLRHHRVQVEMVAVPVRTGGTTPRRAAHCARQTLRYTVTVPPT
jgi:hypothetical protein